MADRSGVLALPEGRLEYVRSGPAPDAAPTLVFLHEGLGSARLWRDLPEVLAARTGCGAFAYSRFGYAGSDARPLPWPLDFMHREALDVLPRVLAAAGIAEHVLIGHSDGASIALIHAGLAATAGLRGVVLEAPHVFTEPGGLASIAEARRRFRDGDLRDRLARHHGANVDVAFNGWAGTWLDPGFQSWNLEACLPAIRVPLLMIQGLADPYGTAAHLEAIRNRVGGPVESLVIEGCGHAPHREARQLYLDRVVAFVAGLVRRDRRHG
jgi:pimeloyl-ACP methyl ester carboxylesterase